MLLILLLGTANHENNFLLPCIHLSVQVQLHQKIYGKSMLSTSKNQQPASQIIETTAMLKLQQQKEQERGSRDSQPVLNGNTPQKVSVVFNDKLLEGKP